MMVQKEKSKGRKQGSREEEKEKQGRRQRKGDGREATGLRGEVLSQGQRCQGRSTGAHSQVRGTWLQPEASRVQRVGRATLVLSCTARDGGQPPSTHTGAASSCGREEEALVGRGPSK